MLVLSLTSHFLVYYYLNLLETIELSELYLFLEIHLTYDRQYTKRKYDMRCQNSFKLDRYMLV